MAEINGKIVGHALFSPYTMRLLEADVRAVNLAPIGVDTKLVVNDEKNRVYARQMCSSIAQEYGSSSITIPLHPLSDSATYMHSKVTPWSAGMACSLAPSPFDDYYAQLQQDKRLPGRVIWSVAFDLA